MILASGVWTIEKSITGMSIKRNVHKQVERKELGHVY